jgi:hypothetical protein
MGSCWVLYEITTINTNRIKDSNFWENNVMKLSGFKKQNKYIIHSLWVTPVLHFIRLSFGGAGHGTIVVEYILFPFYSFSSMLPRSSENAEIILSIFSGISFFQYVIYATLLTIAQKKGKLKIAAVAIILLHVATLFVGLYIWVNHGGHF